MNTTLKGLITSFSKAVDVYNFLLKKHHRHVAVPTEIIEKPDILTDAERADIKTHPYFTDLILKSIVGFEEIA